MSIARALRLKSSLGLDLIALFTRGFTFSVSLPMGRARMISSLCERGVDDFQGIRAIPGK